MIWPVEPTAHLARIQISSHRGDESKGEEEHAQQHALEEGMTGTDLNNKKFDALLM